MKYLRSRVGEWLDQAIDDLLNIAFLASVGLALSRDGYQWAWWVTIVSLVAQFVHVIGVYSGLLMKAGGRGSVSRLRWWVSGTGGGAGPRTIGDLTRRDFVSLVYVVAAGFHVVAAALVWHAAITIASAIVTTIQWIAWDGPEVYPDADGISDSAGGAT